MKFPTLFNIDENGNTRIWYMEVDRDKYRTVSGIEDGQLVESGWTVAEPKNVGRANETTGEQQAFAEVNSKYKKKKEQKYSEIKEQAARSNILQPMLAHSWKDIKDHEAFIAAGVYSQPKLDGIRCIVSKDGMMSRTGKLIVSCPHISGNLDWVFRQYPNLVFDGELYHHDLRDNFNEISSLITKKKPSSDHFSLTERHVQYHVYDIVDTDMTFAERIGFLHSLAIELPVKFVPTLEIASREHLDDIYGDYLADGYEGQMIRTGKSLYQHKRSKDLIKRKEFFDEEFKILDITEGKGNWAGYAKSITCYDPRLDVEFSAGVRGTQEYTRDMIACWKDKPGCYKTVTVRFPNKTPDNIPRFPVAVAVYTGERDI